MEITEINWDLLLLPYNQAVSELTVKLNSLADGYRALSEVPPIESVEGRVKSVMSIIDKAKRKNIPADRIEDDIEDIAGIRIICRFIDDISRVVSVLRERDGLDLEVLQERDYIRNIKPSGYRSYHMIVGYPVITALGRKIVQCEIQVRTLAMNFWAVIEHSLKYKYKGQIPEDVQARLIRSADAASRLDDEVSEIRGEIIDAEHSIVANSSAANVILRKIRALYKVAGIEEADELNRSFFAVCESGSPDRLHEFGRIVQKVADLYGVG